MRPITIDCPRCASTHEFFLRNDGDRHLRQCPDCDGWFLFSETTDADGGSVEALGDPPTCPVAGCEETVDADALPEHVIAEHGASLDPAQNEG